MSSGRSPIITVVRTAGPAIFIRIRCAAFAACTGSVCQSLNRCETQSTILRESFMNLDPRPVWNVFTGPRRDCHPRNDACA